MWLIRDVYKRQAQNQPVAEVTETEVIVPDPDIAPRTVFFNIGSAEVSPQMCIRDRDYENSRLELKHPEFCALVQGHRDSMLLAEITCLLYTSRCV